MALQVEEMSEAANRKYPVPRLLAFLRGRDAQEYEGNMGTGCF
jgi:hypothetical protein